jgi:hypothetical protein
MDNEEWKLHKIEDKFRANKNITTKPDKGTYFIIMSEHKYEDNINQFLCKAS